MLKTNSGYSGKQKDKGPVLRHISTFGRIKICIHKVKKKNDGTITSELRLNSRDTRQEGRFLKAGLPIREALLVRK